MPPTRVPGRDEIRETSWRRLGIEYGLYDDVFAGDISEWLRGRDLPVEKRVAAYLEILRVLRPFVGTPPQLGPRDRSALRQLATSIFVRMLRSRPAERTELIRVLAACWSVSPARTITAFFQDVGRNERSG